MRCQIYQDPGMGDNPGRQRRRWQKRWPKRRCADLATPPPRAPVAVRPPTAGETRHDRGKQGRVSLTIGVDVGGTKVLGGIVGQEGEVLAQARRPTPADDPPRTLQMITEVIAELTAIQEVDAIGIGAAGWIDAARSTVLFAPNLAWRNEPLRDRITRQVGRDVVVENDANVAAWAEFRFGAAKDASDSMVLYTVGTGIGGGIILDGGLV